MTEMPIDSALVGRRVCNAARLDWGEGVVRSVQPTRVGDRPAQRVTVQFTSGTRTVLCPPCRLIDPPQAPVRQAGWLDHAAGNTAEERLRRLPDEVAGLLGTPQQRIAALLPWYVYDAEQPEELLTWARRLVPAVDPLSHWSRDELMLAFGDFCNERDALLRAQGALLARKEGHAALRALVEALPEPQRRRVTEALSRVI